VTATVGALAQRELEPAGTNGTGVVELFAGLGSVARSFKRSAGVEPVLLTDVDRTARDTCLENWPGVPYLLRDVRDVRVADIVGAADGRRVVGLLGCPPCQGFSAAGPRDPADERNALLVEYFRLLLALRPAFFVMENVPSVFRFELLRELLRVGARGYRIWRGVLNGAAHGLPQTRQRAIIVGYRRDLGVSPGGPKPTHLGQRPVFDYGSQRMVDPSAETLAAILGPYPDLGRITDPVDVVDPDEAATEDLVVVEDAIGDLPPAGDGVLAFARDALSPYARRLRGPAVEIANHEPWRHRPDLVERLRRVPEGGAPAELAGRSRDRKYFSQAYARLHRRGLARTITTNFHNPGSGRFAHPTEARSLTIREAARLQGFEDDFRFISYRSEQERLLGNAFPPPLADAIAARIVADLGPLDRLV